MPDIVTSVSKPSKDFLGSSTAAPEGVGLNCSSNIFFWYSGVPSILWGLKIFSILALEPCNISSNVGAVIFLYRFFAPLTPSLVAGNAAIPPIPSTGLYSKAVLAAVSTLCSTKYLFNGLLLLDIGSTIIWPALRLPLTASIPNFCNACVGAAYEYPLLELAKTVPAEPNVLDKGLPNFDIAPGIATSIGPVDNATSCRASPMLLLVKGNTFVSSLYNDAGITVRCP